jgi:hypothetical protein
MKLGQTGGFGGGEIEGKTDRVREPRGEQEVYSLARPEPPTHKTTVHKLILLI